MEAKTESLDLRRNLKEEEEPDIVKRYMSKIFDSPIFATALFDSDLLQVLEGRFNWILRNLIEKLDDIEARIFGTTEEACDHWLSFSFFSLLLQAYKSRWSGVSFSFLSPPSSPPILLGRNPYGPGVDWRIFSPFSIIFKLTRSSRKRVVCVFVSKNTFFNHNHHHHHHHHHIFLLLLLCLPSVPPISLSS